MSVTQDRLHDNGMDSMQERLTGGEEIYPAKHAFLIRLSGEGEGGVK